MEKQSLPSPQVRAHVFVSGTVQGVGYRLAAWDKANQWGVSGWVEEIADGRVEAVFEGTKELVEAIVRWCYRGSPEAIVKNVKVEYEEPEGLKQFIIRRSSEPIVSQNTAIANTKTINILIFVDCLMLTDTSLAELNRYETLWKKVEKSHNLSERIEDIISVDWGQDCERMSETRLDEKINQAQKFISEKLNLDRIRQNPSINNIVLSNSEREPWWRSLVQPMRDILFGAGNGTIYYVGEDGRIAVQLVAYRQILEVLEKYRPQIEKDLKREEPTIKLRFHAIGDGLGAVVINDFLHGLFSHTGKRLRKHSEQAKEPKIVTSDVLQEEKRETVESYLFWRRAAQENRLELGSIVSIASQLPLMLLRSQRVVDAFANGETLQADEIGIPHNAKEIIWKVFYDIDDLQAFPVRPLFGAHPAIQDIQVDVGSGLHTHINYWENQKLHEHIAELLNRRVVS